ncbi:MAG: NUDIX domain-containing protein [Candidatus Heimdallarchaeota archaeon]|nr:NUDIX domain-containing protein [Candidatus Heimdallarchaeota archaeon]MBY8994967.1 NUDIX domain-containing protein [Candidatus Heimdallarchaeota archaeon]
MVKGKFMVAVAAILENHENEILLIKRSSHLEYPDCWEDIGGRLNPSETPEEGLRREIFEETGIHDIEIVKPLTMFHVFRKNEKKAENELIGISYWCKTKTSKVILSEEHTDYKWVTPEDALELTGHPALKRYLKIQMQEKQLAERIIFHEQLEGE